MLATENCKTVATALNNIADLNIAGAIDKDQWEKVVMDYFLHTGSVNWSDFTQRAKQAVQTKRKRHRISYLKGFQSAL
jgi:hypothetical protein